MRNRKRVENAMQNTKYAILSVLVVGLTSQVAVAQEPFVVFDRERGELSEGAQAPSRADLMSAIRSASPTGLRSILEYGERVECHECVPLLEGMLLESDNGSNREMAAWWLRRRPFAVGAIMFRMRTTLQNDTDGTRRARAAEALGELMDPNGLMPLSVAASTDTEVPVRTAAVLALGRLNHPGGNGTIAAAIGDDDPAVRRAALSVVLQVNFFRQYDALLGALADDDADVRQRAALLIGNFRVEAAVPALAGLLRGDTDLNVRQAAAWALGRIGGGDASSALIAAGEIETESLVRDAIEVARRM